MRPLIQTWQRLSIRERVLAAVAGGFLLLVVIRLGVIEPFLVYSARLEENILREADLVEQMLGRQATGPRIAKRVEGLRQNYAALEGRLVPGGSPSLAAARLQERLQSLAGQSGLELVTTQVMKEETLGEFRKATVQVTLRGELPELANFLTGIEYGDWLMSVSTLEMRSSYGVRARRARIRSKNEKILTITMRVGGVMKQEETS